jgi:hypothetical protein
MRNNAVSNIICPNCNNCIRNQEQLYEYTKVIRDAKNFILKTSTMDRLGRLKPLLSGMKAPAVVFDIDETVFQTHCWSCGMSLENVIPINPMRNLYNWAVNKNLAIFFVTARTESGREYTFNELKKNYMDKYAHLFMMPDDSNRTTFQVQTFKSNARKIISNKFTIIANFGDQAHDIRGEPTRYKRKSLVSEGNCYAMKGYLLPDPTTNRKITLVGQGTPMGVAFQMLGRPRKTKERNESITNDGN